MADNFSFTPGTGATGAADDVGGVLYPRVKLAQGADGAATDVSSAAPLQVTLANTGSNSTAVKTDSSATTQPVSAASLPLPTGAATSAKQDTGNTSVASIDTKTPALGQALSAVSVPVVLPAAQITTLTPPAAITGFATEATLGGVLTTSDFDSKVGSLTETAPASDTASSGLNGRLQRISQRLTSLIALLPTALGAGGGLKVDGSGTALPVSGSITANAGTNLNTSALALDATLTGGTQQTKITDGTNVATVKAASTAAVATDKAVVVAISPNNTVPVSLASVPSHAVTNAGTFAVQATLQASSGTDIGKLTANQSVNVAQINGVTPLMGNGTTGTGSQRVTIASDNTAFTVNAAQSGTWNVGTITTLPSIPTGTNTIGNTGAVAVASGGFSKVKYAAQTTTVQTVKGTAGKLGGYIIYNPNATVAYVQVFDVASATTVTLGTTVCDLLIPIPPTSGANLLDSTGIDFTNGIKLACTTTATGSTAPGTGLDMSIFYK